MNVQRKHIPDAAIRLLHREAGVRASNPVFASSASTTLQTYATAVQSPPIFPQLKPPPAHQQYSSPYDAHSAAASAAAAHGTDAQAAANAYAAVLRYTGFGICASVVQPRGVTTPPRGAKSRRSEPPPAGAIVVDAYVDSMASYLTVNSRVLLWNVPSANPRIGIETALGFSAAEAILASPSFACLLAPFCFATRYTIPFCC